MRKIDPKRTVRFGALLAELYYCDILIGDRFVIEINGEQHYNVFYRNGEILDEKFKYLSNFELKKAILWKKGLTVMTIDEDNYKAFINDKDKLENFLFNYLTKMFKNPF
jgi:hypothetical protein